MRQLLLPLFLIALAIGCSQKNMPEETAAPSKETADPTAEYAAQTTFEEGKGVLIEQAARVTANVIAVDRADRSITIRGPEGNVREVELTDDVKNFDQIQPGDTVVLEIYSALVMALAEPGKEFTDRSSTAVAVAQPGDKPKLVNVDMVEVLAHITAINRTTREVTVTGPMGNSVTLQVPPDIERFDTLKIGDKVNARYVEAFAISVQEI